ncbi:MAG: FAD-dependent oxidoreductase [Burkholderiales bacterium]|nr:FAD-dependent oxidoreductase [Burkholderiales bacterium]
MKKFDYVIVGGGIIGLTIGCSIKRKYPQSSLLLIEKEADVAKHASGRNSGVLHAGLYYAQDSLKSKFCKEGSKLLIDYCNNKGIGINRCGKVIVAASAEELDILYNLYNKACANKVDVKIVDEYELDEIEPCAKTYEKALYSPATASFNALGICMSLKKDLTSEGVQFLFNNKRLELIDNNTIHTSIGIVNYGTLINCAGMYADKIAQSFGLNLDYLLIPFKGVFLEATDLIGNLKTHIYQAPNSKLSLLGVHLSPDYQGKIKLGPTALPCLARENYNWLSNLKFNEVKEVVWSEFKMVIHNKNGFRDHLLVELKKQSKQGLINHSSKLVKNIKQFNFNGWGITGIQPRLYNLANHTLIDDFMVKSINSSIHIINSVSPAFTASFAFSEYVVEHYL